MAQGTLSVTDGKGNVQTIPVTLSGAANLLPNNTRPGDWSVQSNPAVNVQASASKGAGAAGVQHVCTSLSFSLAQDSTGGTPYAGTVNEQMSPNACTAVGGSQPHENMSPYLVLNFCIALQGIFPSRN